MDDGLQNGDSLKNHLFDGMDVDPNFLKAYGKQLDEYADNIQKAGKNAKTSEIDINGFNESLVRSGQEAVKTTTFMQDIGNGLKSFGKTALGITDVADAASDLTDIASRANSKVDGFGSAIKGVWNVIKANPLASGAIGAALTNYLVSAQGINYLIYQSFKGIQKGTLQNRCIAMSLFFTAAVKLFLILLLIQV